MEVFAQDYCDPEGDIQIPFMRIPTNFLESAVNGFEANHKPWLLRLIRDFEPYAAVLRYARQHDLIEGDFGRFWSQTERHRNQIRETKLTADSEWYKNNIDVHIAEIEKMKGRDGDGSGLLRRFFRRQSSAWGVSLHLSRAAKIRASAKSTMCWPF